MRGPTHTRGSLPVGRLCVVTVCTPPRPPTRLSPRPAPRTRRSTSARRSRRSPGSCRTTRSLSDAAHRCRGWGLSRPRCHSCLRRTLVRSHRTRRGRIPGDSALRTPSRRALGRLTGRARARCPGRLRRRRRSRASRRTHTRRRSARNSWRSKLAPVAHDRCRRPDSSEHRGSRRKGPPGTARSDRTGRRLRRGQRCRHRLPPHLLPRLRLRPGARRPHLLRPQRPLSRVWSATSCLRRRYKPRVPHPATPPDTTVCPPCYAHRTTRRRRREANLQRPAPWGGLISSGGCRPADP